MMKYALSIVISVALTILFWASAFVGIKSGLQAFSPGELAFLRFFIASMVLTTLFFFQKSKLPKKEDIPLILLAGFMGFTVYNLSLNYGELSISSGTASFLVNMGPIFTALLAVGVLKEKGFRWSGIAVSFIGVTLIVIGEGSSFTFNIGAGLIVIAAFSQACFFVLQKPLLKKYKPLDVSIYTMWSGTFFLAIFLPGSFQHLIIAPPNVTGVLIYLGIFPSAIANLLWTFALSKQPAAKLSVFLYIVPIMTIIIGWIWLGELPSLISMIGGIVTLFGVYIVNKKKIANKQAVIDHTK